MELDLVKVIAEDAVNHEMQGLLFQRINYNQLYVDVGYSVVEFRFKKNNSLCLSLVAGIKNQTLNSPFSAPYGGFIQHSQQVSISDYLLAAQLLKTYMVNNRIINSHIVLPPVCYGGELVTKQMFALQAVGYELKYSDLNYSLDLTKSSFDSGLKKVARRCLKKSKSHHLEFSLCLKRQHIVEAYEVIRKNRTQRNNPLKLSLEDLLEIRKVTEVDFFSIRYKSQVVAGAVVYKVAENIGQVIYWGNDVELNHLNSIHFLAESLFDYYKPFFNMLDIGPSSLNGEANVGLCRFKESLGCDTTPKFKLSLQKKVDEEGD